MTGQRTEPWRDAIRATGASITQISTLAGELADLDAGHLESLLQEFAADGEEQALSRLLQVCAYNAVKLDPTILCGCLGVCENIFDAAPCFALQDEHAVAPLLRAAAEPALSLERNCFAVRLAAELTRKFVLDPQPVRNLGARQPVPVPHPPDLAQHLHGDHLIFPCLKMRQQG